MSILIVSCLLYILILWCIYECYADQCIDAVGANNPVQSNNPIRSSNPVQSHNPVFNYSSNVQRLQTSAQPDVFLPIYLEATRQHIENFNLRSLETQSSLRGITLTNSTDSTQQQVPNNNNSNVRRAPTIPIEHQTLRSPPSYDDFIRQSSVAIPIEEHSFLPPSYDDFIRTNNQTYETN
jgi:hypothetical protein